MALLLILVSFLSLFMLNHIVAIVILISIPIIYGLLYLFQKVHRKLKDSWGAEEPPSGVTNLPSPSIINVTNNPIVLNSASKLPSKPPLEDLPPSYEECPSYEDSIKKVNPS